MSSLDAIKQLGGVLSAWNHLTTKFMPFLSHAGLLLEGCPKGINNNLRLINCYGPYVDRRMFWDGVKEDGFSKNSTLILGWDLKFTKSTREIWGNFARVDPLAEFLNQLILEEGLVDVDPMTLHPTWRNGRGGIEGVAKRLDMYLFFEELASSVDRFQTLIMMLKIWGHMLVVLWIEHGRERVKYPFTFNPIWLKEHDFTFMVR